MFNLNYLKEKSAMIFSQAVFYTRETIKNMSSKDKRDAVIFIVIVLAVYNIIEFYLKSFFPHILFWLKIDILTVIFNQLILLIWLPLFILFRRINHSITITISFIAFAIFILAERANEGRISNGVIIAHTALTIMLAFSFVFINQLFGRFRKFFVSPIINGSILVALFSIPALVAAYRLGTGHHVRIDVVGAALQTNISEAYEYIDNFIGLESIFLFIAMVIFTFLLFFIQSRKRTQEIGKSALIFAVFLFAVIAMTPFSNFRLFNQINFYYQILRKEDEGFKRMQAQIEKRQVKFFAEKQQQGETYIVVIGESLSKKHMSLYGYSRNTTPNLDEMYKNGEIVVLKNAISSGIKTHSTLARALTEANQYNGKKPHISLTITNILNKANMDVYWITNQKLFGLRDFIATSVARPAKEVIRTSGSFSLLSSRVQKYDGVVINELRKILDKSNNSKKNKVIFMHLYGSHIDYENRYPHDKYSVFTEKMNQGDFGKIPLKQKYRVKSYDNSVLYNDYVVYSLIKELQKHKGVGGFLYFPDHSEEVFLAKQRIRKNFTYAMVEIPMIGWFSDEYKKRYPVKYNNLNNNINKLYSNDMIYDTLIGMMGVKTDRYDSAYDFTSDKYSLLPSDIKIFNNRKYLRKDNYIWWQKQNSKYIIDTKQGNRVYVHRVNSIGKLNEVWSEGFRAFEIDVRFGDNKTKTFRVGHHRGAMGYGLERYLSSINHKQLKRIWVDFKNLHKNNFRASLQRFNELDEKFNLKEKFIIESPTTKPFFKEFSKSGWHTSYYLPSGKMVEAIKSKDVKIINALNKEISQQVKEQGVSAISFHRSAYPFVKKYLEGDISKDIVYHIWHSPKLYDKNFKKRLEKDPLYLDKRVKSLLSKYKSDFSLTP